MLYIRFDLAYMYMIYQGGSMPIFKTKKNTRPFSGPWEETNGNDDNNDDDDDTNDDDDDNDISMMNDNCDNVYNVE